MSIIEKLKKLNLADDANLTLTCSEGTDVFHFNESQVEDAMNETDVINQFAALIAQSKLDVRNRWNGNVLEHLRAQDYLEEYERGSYDFEGYLAETLSENFYDHDLIEHSTEKYDHKRGFTTLTAAVDIPVSNFIEVNPFISGWTVSVETGDGTLTFDG